MNTHHAVLLCGSDLSATGYDTTAEQLESEFEVLRYEILSIVDVRSLIAVAYVKPLTFATKTIVIEAAAITPEAQQALLKVLEEPPRSTKFIMVLRSLDALLPTLLSRVLQPAGVDVPSLLPTDTCNLFLQSSYAIRLALVAKITKDKDVEQIESLRSGLLWYIKNMPASALAHVLLTQVAHMNQRGASKKMLLEEIALTLPVV